MKSADHKTVLTNNICEVSSLQVPGIDQLTFILDWLTNHGLKGRQDVELPEEIVQETGNKYKEAFELIVGQKWDDALTARV